MKVLLCLLMLAGSCFAYDYGYDCEEKHLRPNWSTGEAEYASDDEKLKWNWSTDEWSYETEESELRYNPSTMEHEYVD